MKTIDEKKKDKKRMSEDAEEAFEEARRESYKLDDDEDTLAYRGKV